MNSDVMHTLRLVTLVGLSVLAATTPALAQTASPANTPASSTPAPLPPTPDEILPTTAIPVTPPVPVPAPSITPPSTTPPGGAPVFVTPAPLPTAPLPTTLERVSATLRTVQKGAELTLNLTLLNGQANAVAFSAGRDSAQNCAAAPLIRVLRVGTREVVYPGSEKRICTQELSVKTALLGGSIVFSRTLTLAPGDYLVESWFQGFAGPMQSRVKLSAPPLRVSVK